MGESGFILVALRSAPLHELLLLSPGTEEHHAVPQLMMERLDSLASSIVAVFPAQSSLPFGKSLRLIRSPPDLLGNSQSLPPGTSHPRLPRLCHSWEPTPHSLDRCAWGFRRNSQLPLSSPQVRSTPLDLSTSNSARPSGRWGVWCIAFKGHGRKDLSRIAKANWKA